MICKRTREYVERTFDFVQVTVWDEGSWDRCEEEYDRW